MNAPLYTRDILRLAATIPDLATFDELADATEVRSPTCGSKVRVALEMDADGKISGLRQAVEACAFGQAAASLMAANAIGKNSTQVRAALTGIEAWLQGDDLATDSWPDLATLAPARSRRGRHGAILLPFRALLRAMEEGR